MHKILFAFLVAMFCGAGTATAGGPTGVVSFSVDNINKSFIERAVPIFERHGICGTLYAQTRPIGVESWDMTWNDIRHLQRKCWEIGAHSYSHEVKLSQADQATLDLELGAPAARIFREIGEYPRTFATPFGDFDERVLDEVRHYYDSHIMAWGNEGRNPMTGVDPFRVNRVEITPIDSNEKICGMMEAAARDKQWLVFMMHSIVDKLEVEDKTIFSYKITYDQLDAALACAARLRDERKIEVMTVADALEEIPHIDSRAQQ